LSNRYIADRFLPDKAIDLVDEAASKLRMEMDSMPVELDEVERRMMQLSIEREALKKETDAASRARLRDLEDEVKSLQDKRDELRARWEAEKSALTNVSTIKQQIEAAKLELQRAKDAVEYAKASEIEYGTLPDL